MLLYILVQTKWIIRFEIGIAHWIRSFVRTFRFSGNVTTLLIYRIVFDYNRTIVPSNILAFDGTEWIFSKMGNENALPNGTPVSWILCKMAYERSAHHIDFIMRTKDDKVNRNWFIHFCHCCGATASQYVGTWVEQFTYVQLYACKSVIYIDATQLNRSQVCTSNVLLPLRMSGCGTWKLVLHTQDTKLPTSMNVNRIQDEMQTHLVEGRLRIHTSTQ